MHLLEWPWGDPAPGAGVGHGIPAAVWKCVTSPPVSAFCFAVTSSKERNLVSIKEVLKTCMSVNTEILPGWRDCKIIFYFSPVTLLQHDSH